VVRPRVVKWRGKIDSSRICKKASFSKHNWKGTPRDGRRKTEYIFGKLMKNNFFG